MLLSSRRSNVLFNSIRTYLNPTLTDAEPMFDYKKRTLRRNALLSASDNLITDLKGSKGRIDWDQIKQECIKRHPAFFNKYNFEVQLMQYLVETKEDDENIVLSLARFVEKLLDETPNKVIKAHYIVFVTNILRNLDPGNVKKMLDELVNDTKFSKFPAVFNAYIGYARLSPETCQEALKVLDHESLLRADVPKLVLMCLKHNFIDDAFRLLNTYIPQLSSTLLNALYKAIPRNPHKYRDFIQLLHDKRSVVDFENRHHFFTFLNRMNSKITQVKIDPITCECSCCKSKLETFTEKESEILRIHVKQNLLIKDGNPYIKSTPEELDSFIKFTEQTREPFDLVVDALNCSYWAAVRTLQQEKDSQKIVVATLGLKENLWDLLHDSEVFEKFNRICIIGRKHMENWTSIQKLRQLEDRVEVFLLQNTSDDDIFLLYSALLNPKTHILTMDYFREHATILGPEAFNLFQKWTDCRVVTFLRKKGGKDLQFPPGVNTATQINNRNITHFCICTIYDRDRKLVKHWYCCMPPNKYQ